MENGVIKRKCRIDQRYVMNMLKIPFDREYNMIFGSWAFGYLTDDEILDFLDKAKDSLIKFNADPGMIILKENTREELDENEKCERQ